MNEETKKMRSPLNAPSSPFIPNEKSSAVIFGGEEGWNGWITEGNNWSKSKISLSGNPLPEFECWESKGGSNDSLCSPLFKINGDKIRFWLSGYDVLNNEAGEGGCFLRLAKSGIIVQEAAPPLKTEFVANEWFVRNLKGQEVYLEIKRSQSFADSHTQLAVSHFEEIYLSGLETKEAFYCLDVPVAHSQIWGLTKIDYEGNETARHLSSCIEGDDGIGIIKSPAFIITAPSIRLKLRGYYHLYNPNKNKAELIDEKTGEVLRVMYPPNSNFPEWSQWDVSDLSGRKVSVQLIDSDNGPHTAWFGLDEMDAGGDYSINFNNGDEIDEWQVIAAPPRYMELYGLPFIANRNSLFKSGHTYAVNVGISVKHLLISGMKVSERNSFSTEDKQVTVGQSSGSLRICYSDGEAAVYPLIIGESLWWGEKFMKYPEPFVSFTEVKRALQDSLRIYPAQPTPLFQYVASINPLAKPIERIEYVPDKQTGLIPVITGFTVIPLSGQDQPAQSIAAKSNGISAELAAILANRPLRQENQEETASLQRIQKIQNYMYVTESSFPQHFPIDIPMNYKGPEVHFQGNKDAAFFTNAFYHNVADMTSKVDDKGVYHTSSPGALSYGYDGIGGTFSMDYKLHPEQEFPGMYYAEAWSRDIGRTLMELIAFGFIEQAVLCADWCLSMARVWEESDNEELQINGQRLPRHIHRILQYPSTKIGTGCFENDGHGLTSLFIYQLWKHLPERDEWLRTRWEDIKGLGDWIIWQFDHPEISKATDVLWSDSEGSGYPISIGHSIFCDLPCVEALHGLAEMAASIGESDSAQQWETTACKLKIACDKFYIETNADNQQVWTDKYRGFGRGSLLGPLLLPTDTKGLWPENCYPEWYALNEAEYEINKAQFVPWAMGYNAAFTTQASLLLDRMEDAAGFMELNAKLIYGPVYRQYIVPEIGGAVNKAKQIYSRFGDLGNAVQQAEILKAVKIIIGVDDSQKSELGLIPRLPLGWDGVCIRDYPILLEDENRRINASLQYSMKLEESRAEISVESSEILPEVKLRVGPFSKSLIDAEAKISLNNIQLAATVELSGDSLWVRFRVPAGKFGFQVDVQLA